LNKTRLKKKKNKSEQNVRAKFKIKPLWAVLGGIATMSILAALYLSNSGTKEVIPVGNITAPSSQGVPAPLKQQVVSPDGSKRLTFSILPLTAENDLAVLYGGAEYSNPGDLYEWEVNGAVLTGEQSLSLKKGRFKKGDTLRVKLLLNGGSQSVITDPVVVENSAPKISSIKIEPFPATKRDTLTPQITAADADGDPISYSFKWTREDGSVVGNEASIKGALFNKNEKIILEVIPSDGQVSGPPFRTAVILANALPKITSIPASFSGNEYSYQVTAEDPDQDPITFTLTKGPPGMTIDHKTGLIKWAFTDKDAGNYPVEIMASDGEGTGELQSFMLPLSFTTTSNTSPTVESKAEK